MTLRSLVSLGTVCLLSTLATALPTSVSTIEVLQAANSTSHNLYLVTCIPKNTTSFPQNFTAVSYFKQPIGDTPIDPDEKAPRGDQSAEISSPPYPWEGTRILTKVWKNKQLTIDITSGSNTLAKGGIAGASTLGTEQYICFKDGDTAIRYKADDDDDKDGKKKRGNCVADYWCASLDDGKGKDGT